jgi:hypothetical protein
MVEESRKYNLQYAHGRGENMISPLLGITGSFLGSRLLSLISTQNVNVVHTMPGRIRLQSNQWKSKKVSQLFESAFKVHFLIHQVTASPVTGTLLVEFKVPYITKNQLDQLIQQAVDLSVSTYPHKSADLTKGMKGLINKANGIIKTRTLGKADLNSLLILFLLGKGLCQFKKNPSFATGLLLWAYGLLTREVDNNE